MIESDITAVYTKGGSCPKPMLLYEGKILTEGVDYTLSYRNNKAVGDESSSKVPTIIIKGKGNLSGSTKIPFEIIQANIGSLTIEVADKVYTEKVNGALSNPKIVDVDGKVLKADIDYEKNPVYTYKKDTTLVNGAERKPLAFPSKQNLLNGGRDFL